MLIPVGVNNLGVSVDPEPLFKAIVNSEPDDDYLRLEAAILEEADGKANDIIRIFETDVGDKIGICNKDYGLLEKADRLTYLEVEDDKTNITTKIMVVRDRDGNAVGFISGINVII